MVLQGLCAGYYYLAGSNDNLESCHHCDVASQALMGIYIFFYLWTEPGYLCSL